MAKIMDGRQQTIIQTHEGAPEPEGSRRKVFEGAEGTTMVNTDGTSETRRAVQVDAPTEARYTYETEEGDVQLSFRTRHGGRMVSMDDAATMNPELVVVKVGGQEIDLKTAQSIGLVTKNGNEILPVAQRQPEGDTPSQPAPDYRSYQLRQVLDTFGDRPGFMESLNRAMAYIGSEDQTTEADAPGRQAVLQDLGKHFHTEDVNMARSTANDIMAAVGDSLHAEIAAHVNKQAADDAIDFLTKQMQPEARNRIIRSVLYGDRTAAQNLWNAVRLGNRF
jgi:hypothetical protein